METFKNYKDMNEQEKKDYIQSFDNFTAEGYKELVACQNAWSESCLKSFKQALAFLTAFSKFKKFVTDTEHFQDYKRRLNSVIYYLDVIREETGLNKVSTISASDTKEHIAAFAPTADPDAPANTAKTAADGTTLSDAEKAAAQQQLKDEVVNQHVPLPSDHISAYKHLLSPDLQVEADGIAALRGQIALHAELAKKYHDAGAAPAAIASETNQAVDLNNLLAIIYDRIDAELVDLKAQGENIALPEILAQAVRDRQAELKKEKEEAEAKAKAEAEEPQSSTNLTKAEIDALPEGENKEALKKLRIESNKRYLVRKDVKLTAKREAEIALRTAELEAWGITLNK